MGGKARNFAIQLVCRLSVAKQVACLLPVLPYLRARTLFVQDVRQTGGAVRAMELQSGIANWFESGQLGFLTVWATMETTGLVYR